MVFQRIKTTFIKDKLFVTQSSRPKRDEWKITLDVSNRLVTLKGRKVRVAKCKTRIFSDKLLWTLDYGPITNRENSVSSWRNVNFNDSESICNNSAFSRRVYFCSFLKKKKKKKKKKGEKGSNEPATYRGLEIGRVRALLAWL